MPDDVNARGLIASGQQAFVEMAGAAFDATSDAALTAFLKLRAFMRNDSRIEGLYQSAQQGTLNTGFDDLFERVRTAVLTWELGAIIRQVVLPLAGVVLGYAEAVAAGLAGGTPILIGFLVGAVIYLALAPGTWQMLKTRITSTIDEIFRPAGF